MFSRYLVLYISLIKDFRREGSNMHTFLKCLNLCIFWVILLSERSGGADYRYEACVTWNCGKGPNISFPFYIPGQQESYCGYPGFGIINCSQHGFPLIQLRENEYVIQDIIYQTRTLRVHDAAVSNPHRNGCFPRIRNTSLPRSQFGFVDNVTQLRLFSDCSSSLSGDLLRHRVACDARGRDNVDLILYERDENFTNALENCGRNIVAPVEKRSDDGKIGMGNLEQVLRRGFALNWISSRCDRCKKSGGRCGFNATTYDFTCFCRDGPRPRRCRRRARGAKKSRSTPTVVLATAIAGGGVFLLLCLFALIIWHCKRIKGTYLFSRNISKSDVEGGSGCYFGIPILSYSELVVATNNFDSSKLLGDGGFGTVYHGKLGDGREVAVKRLYEHNCRRMEQFMNEIKILTCTRHQNLVSLYGCTSRASKELLLVYEYIPNGTVADHLHGERANEAPLNWAVRMNIAIETAAALAYLHNSDIIHRDVKTDNLLLDNKFCVKVADFGISRQFPSDVTHISTAPQGTLGYVDPEYHQCYQLTDKSDVYSFGVVLVELVSSMPAVDINRNRHEINLANLAVNKIQTRAFDELIDSSLGYKSDAEVTRMTTSVAELALRCLQLEKGMRPSMDEILDSLKEIQSGGDYKWENVKEGNDESSVMGNIPLSPETDTVEEQEFSIRT